MNARPSIRVLVWVAMIQVALGLLVAPWALRLPTTTVDGHAYPPSVHLLLTLVFAAGALMLLVGGARDERAVLLGAFFLCSGAVYAERLIERFLGGDPNLPVALLQLLLWVPIAAFQPFVLWRFVALFPRTHASLAVDRVVRTGGSLVGIVGVVLTVVNLPLLFQDWFDGYQAPDLSLLWAPRQPGTLFGDLVVFLVGVALVLGLFRLRADDRQEARRVRVLLGAVAMGFGPLVVFIALDALLPPVSQWLERPVGTLASGWLIYPALLSLPFTTGYAVLVHRVLDVRLIARKALRYGLARWSALVLATLPLLALVAYLYGRRDESLAEVFSGVDAAVFFAAAALGLYVFSRRQALLDAVDRRFFRDQYDARQILSPLLERIRSTRGSRELAEFVTLGIDRALHLESIALLVEDPARGELVDPGQRVAPLGTAGPLASLVASSPRALVVDPEVARSTLDSLAEEERSWILDGGFRTLVAVTSSDGSLSALIALGEKKSGLPLLGEDRQLLSAIAGATALALELQRLTSQRSNGAVGGALDLPSTAPAQECFGCGRLYLPHNVRCPTCQRDLEAALVPYVLPGRFRFERRIGAGGMGVVYRAVDLALGRPVAIKTMRRFSVGDAVRLRREARAAAAVRHPNLAVIYGVESWHGNPMLSLEFLEAGTLQQRIEQGPLAVRAVLDLGIALAGALEKLHAANILHRDLKPSNIGFSADGTPKLMDFGIARLRFDLRREATVLGDGLTRVHGLEATSWSADVTSETASRQLVGTLHYLSPEAVKGELPEAGFDLWGLSVVLYECLVGHRIFRGTVREVMTAISAGDIPDLRDQRRDLPAAVAETLSRFLARDRSRRPASAQALRHELELLRARVENPPPV
ncbi:MAG: serine/threonine protein kinase [Acidobacteria bacterium]|nr:serine/threonine protein kinase [Acidobacteriota bacterium]